MKMFWYKDGAIRSPFNIKFHVDADSVKMAILGLIEQGDKVTRSSVIKEIKHNLFTKGSTWMEYGAEQLSHNFRTHEETQELFHKLFSEFDCKKAKLEIPTETFKIGGNPAL